MIIREFVTRLGFDADESKVRSFDRAVSGLRTGLLAAVGAMTAVATAAGVLVNETARYGDEAAKTARTLGMTAEGLQGLRFAFGRVGVEQSELTNGLERLSRNLGQAARGEDTARKGFDALGISIFGADGQLRQINELMPEIVEGLNNVEGEAQSAAIAADLFGRSGIRLGRAMRQGSGELEALVDEYERLGGGLTNEQAEEAEAFTDAMTNMGVVIQGIRLQVGARLMPVLRPMVDAFTAFMVANREIITTRIEQAFVLIGDAMSNLMGIARGVMDIFTPILGLITDMGPAGAAAAAAFLALVVPFGKFRGLLIAAVFLAALEDIGAWMKNQPSLIGGLLGPYEEFAQKVADLVEQLGGLERVSQMVIGVLLARWAWGVMAAMAAAATSVGLLTASLSLLNKNPLIRLVTIGMHDPSAPALRDMNLGTMPTGLDQRLGAEDGETFGAMLNRRIFGRGDLGNVEPPAIDAPVMQAPSFDAPRFEGDIFDFMRKLEAEISIDLPDQSVTVPETEMMRQMEVIQPSNNNTVSMEFTQHITTPPGSTAEQNAYIARETERAIGRHVDRAVKALED